MNLNYRHFALAAATALTFSSTAFGADRDDDDDKAPAGSATLPMLSVEQQRAAGVVVAHPANTSAPQRDEAIGLVLDPLSLVTDVGEADASAAAARAAGAELERVRGLYGAGAGASLKALQTAQAEQARARAQADAASAKLAANWPPLVAMPAAERQKLIDRVAAAKTLLVRADLPGRHILAKAPDKALLDVDGVSVEAFVLGLGAPSGADAQSVAVLIEVRAAPPGLGAGARVPVALLGAPRTGVAVPRDAVLYDEGGALVYKQLAKQPGSTAAAPARYTPVRVKLIQPHGDGWIVDGIDDDDDIVVHGAGVLWSLQGIIGHAAGDNDDD
ncbi:MAG TPA: hypothetical protein VHQ21_12190 [Rhodanobacteraceae bacterium]|nr:hypothetical protein [Rhodanobacteraceae bacterium]